MVIFGYLALAGCANGGLGESEDGGAPPGQEASAPDPDGAVAPGDDLGTTPPPDSTPLPTEDAIWAPIPDQGTSTTCGNGTLEAGEQCDGTNLNNKTCIALGYAGGGTLACKSNCMLDTSGCTQTTSPSGNKYGEKCGGSYGTCASGLVCVLFNESGTSEGYCTTECSSTNPCPNSPPGGQCVFELKSSGKSICGFLCSASKPSCPNGLSCTYSTAGQYHYCTTDAPAKCGNNVIELAEECDGTDLNNMSCSAFGYGSGTLKCSSSCKYDKSSCTGTTGCTSLPPKDCTGGDAYCSKLVLFSPTQGTGYIATHGNSFSYIRQDTMMLVKYASAAVSCMMPGSYPIGLGDMSMPNGGTPADSYGNLRHPQGTHDYGRDIDVAYYQTGQPNNYLRPVCPHTSSGVEQYHCVGTPNILDVERSALFIAKIFESDRVRVMGVDGKIGPLIEAQAKKLHALGKISTASLNAFSSKLAYETTDTKKGWYLFHHHHLHLSTWTTSYATPIQPEPPVIPNGAVPEMPLKVFPVNPLSGSFSGKLAIPDPKQVFVIDLQLLDRAATRPEPLGSFKVLQQH